MCSIDELGVFRSGKGDDVFVRILWLHCKGNEVLELQKAVDEALVPLFPKEDRFQSHITIARAYNVKGKQELLDYVKKFKVPEASGTVASFSLMKSTRTDKGSVFEVIERYPLR